MQDRLDPAHLVKECLPGRVRHRNERGNRARDAFGRVKCLVWSHPGGRLERRREIGHNFGECENQPLEAGKTQHRWKRPKLSDRKRLVLLIGNYEICGAREADMHVLGVEHAVGQCHNPRDSLIFGCGQTRQAAVEGVGHVLAHLPDGAPNMKLVVQQPLGRFRGMMWRLDAKPSRAI